MLKRTAVMLGVGLMATSAWAQSNSGCYEGGAGYRWTLRGLYNRVLTDGDEIRTDGVRPDGTIERSKLDIGNGDGLGLGLEYRFNCPVGLEVGYLTNDLDSNFFLDLNEDWGMDMDELGMDILTVGLNFHLTPRSAVDFFVGPLIGFVQYDDVSFNALGESFSFGFDDDTAFGLNVGLDVPFGAGSPWAFTAAAKYLSTSAEADDGSFELDVNPLIVGAGIAYRWNGKSDPPCDCADPIAEPEPEPEPMVKEEPKPEPPPPPPPPPPPAPAPRPEEREVIHFDTDSARVSNIGKAKLDEVALKMKQDPELRAFVIGHTDSTGNDAINDPLSVRRAEAVKEYLVERHQIDPSRIAVEGRGSREPVASNDTRDGRAENRRAVVIIRIE